MVVVPKGVGNVKKSSTHMSSVWRTSEQRMYITFVAAAAAKVNLSCTGIFIHIIMFVSKTRNIQVL